MANVRLRRTGAPELHDELALARLPVDLQGEEVEDLSNALRHGLHRGLQQGGGGGGEHEALVVHEGGLDHRHARASLLHARAPEGICRGRHDEHDAQPSKPLPHHPQCDGVDAVEDE
eukprot:5973288-Alexandrium_andersonii.AAC.2